ncbi:ScpA family protein [Quadrisphaera sp. INWT6]|uniref:segregation and condensation protein A n=1 Tax=Quadrisphaera sp. INWT6 TaxID=2596917 RepID=UPI0019D543E7|nr:ScpA family protein [Quadrisphaera sp. INWT6]
MPPPEPGLVDGVDAGALPAPRASSEQTPRSTPGGVLTDRDAPAFDVHLENFSGPFDLLLGLISRRRLEITEVALAAVTDEFIAHLRRMLAAADDGADSSAAALGQASGFLVVAATLLDLKAARLLPAEEGAEPDADDLALVEARDLLFARLLQHRAYAQVGGVLADRLAEGALSSPRPGGTGAADDDVRRALPELVLPTTPEQLAVLAAGALAAAGRPPEAVAVEHLHAPVVSVPEQVAALRERLRERHAGAPGTPVAFADLLADLVRATGERPGAVWVVGRFLAVLELYRRGEVDLEQARPDQALLVTWREPADPVVDLREPVDLRERVS